MKKITLLLLVTVFSLVTTAQNVLQNHSFEDDPTTFTVTEGTSDVVRRIANMNDIKTQTSSPSTAQINVADGMWLKKSPSSGYIKGILTSAEKQDGAKSLNLRILAGTTQTGLTKWWQCVLQQRISGGLDETEKYTVTFYAKVDETVGNVCSKVVAYVRDQGSGKNISKTINLSGGTTWTEYSVEFDLPSHKVTYPTANFTTAYFGIGNTTTYNDASKTNYSGVLLDNIVLMKTNEINTGIGDNKVSSFTAIGTTNAVKLKNIKRGQKISVYNLTGALVASKIGVSKELSIKLNKGIYLVKVDNATKKVLVK